MRRFSDEWYELGLKEAVKLSDTSKKVYLSRLNSLQKVVPGRKIDWIISHPGDVFSAVAARYSEIQTQKALVNALLTIFRHVPGVAERYANSRKAWRKHFERVHDKAEERYDNNEPSERQRDGFVPWEQVISKRDSLDQDSFEYLWLCMHTMIPPVRADLHDIRIFHNREPNNAEKLRQPNFIVLRSTGDGCQATLRLGEFKTAVKAGQRKIEEYRKDLPEQLCRIISRSLRRQPRDHLLISPKTRQPWKDAHPYTNFINNMLKRLFGRNLTISLVRHSFVTSLDHSRLKSGQKDALARDMMHNPSTFDRYRIIFDDDTAAGGSRCECECR